MTVLKKLDMLIESTEVSQINDKLKERVSEKALSALSSKMKENIRGRFYNNEAMAILKTITAYDNSVKGRKYIEDNITRVYAILKTAKRGDTGFNAMSILNAGMNSDNPKEYWMSIYSKSHSGDKPKIDISDNTVKNLKDSLLIFPKIYHKYDEGERVIDVDKSANALRTLSAKLAQQDTSDSIDVSDPFGEIGQDAGNPRVNHWCVASSDKKYYTAYSSEGVYYLFIVAIKKKADGTPDFNDRYLFYVKHWVGEEEENDDEERNNAEFADKFDRHVELSKVFSPSGETYRFLSKLKNDSKMMLPKSEKKSKLRDDIRAEKNEVWYDGRRKRLEEVQAMSSVQKNNIEKLKKHLVEWAAKDPRNYQSLLNATENFIKKEMNNGNITEKDMIRMSEKTKTDNLDGTDGFWYPYRLVGNYSLSSSYKDGLCSVEYSNGRITKIYVSHELSPIMTEYDGMAAFEKGNGKCVLRDKGPFDFDGVRYENTVNSYGSFTNFKKKTDTNTHKIKHPIMKQTYDSGYNDFTEMTRLPTLIVISVKGGSGMYGYRIENNEKTKKHPVYKVNRGKEKMIGYLEDKELKP